MYNAEESKPKEQPHIARRGGLIPMQVPVSQRNKAPGFGEKIDLTLLKNEASAGKFARALGIPDIAARHLLNNKKFKPLKPNPRHEFRPGI